MTWYTVLDDSFTHADTTPGGANSTTGVPTTPTVGAANSWTDIVGGHWSIVSNSLSNGNDNGDFANNVLLRPLSELAGADQRMVVTSTNTPAGFLKINSTLRVNGNSFYLAESDAGVEQKANIYKVVAGTAASISQATLPTQTTGHQYSLDFQAVGTSPTVLTLVISDITGTTTGYPLTLTVNDSSSGLQVTSGRVGLTSYVGNVPQAARFSRVQSFSATPPAGQAAFTASPSSLQTSTTATAVTLTGANTSWTSSTTFSVSGGSGASITSKTFTSPTSVTIQLVPGTSAASLTISDSTDAATTSITVSAPAAGTPGTFTLLPSSTGITVSVSGSSNMATFSFYRGTVANFAPATGNRLATQAGVSYVDSTASAGVTYFYKVLGVDQVGSNFNILPANLTGASTGVPLALATSLLSQAIAEVYVGDSITYGALADGGVGPCGPAAAYLANINGSRSVTYSNRGISGSQTSDWAPGGSALNGALAAMTTLLGATPTALPVFSIMLGTNDSAFSVSANTYKSNLQAIITQIKTSFSNAVVILNASPWYSPNAVTSYTYNEASLALMFTYRDSIKALALANTNVFVGDLTSFAFMATNYATDLAAENGSNGSYRIHPNHQGNLDLGALWGQAAAVALGIVQSSAGTIPAAADTRFGTAVGSTTGTLRVPAASDVRAGTLVDATTGTLVVSGGGGGTPNPTTFAIQSGALPAGLSLSSSGLLSGTPTATGTFTFVIRATNTSGHTDSASQTITIAATGSAPVNSAAPAISGTAQVGQTLTVSNGTWSGSPTYTYQWRRAGTAISGATSSTYSPVSGDVGSSLTCAVTATNSSGSATATSAATAAVTAAASAPVNSAAPVITGTAQSGSTLTVSNGTWSGSPTYAYQWKRAGTNISGATSSTYACVSADIGSTLTCTVTATNGAGSATATSAATAAVTAMTGRTDSGTNRTATGLGVPSDGGTGYTASSGSNFATNTTGIYSTSNNVDENAALDTGMANGSAEIEFVEGPSTTGVQAYSGVVFRYVDANNFLYAVPGANGHFYIFSRVGGTDSTLLDNDPAVSGLPYFDGYTPLKLKVTYSGSTITIYVAQTGGALDTGGSYVSRGSITSTQFQTATKVGFRMYAAASSLHLKNLHFAP